MDKLFNTQVGDIPIEYDYRGKAVDETGEIASVAASVDQGGAATAAGDFKSVHFVPDDGFVGTSTVSVVATLVDGVTLTASTAIAVTSPEADAITLGTLANIADKVPATP